VKWNKVALTDIEVELSQDVLTFKTQIYALSNVPVDKQKLMYKGKLLKVSTKHSKP
jgi:ubiquitin carboxyl-terminal hydrolase 14